MAIFRFPYFVLHWETGRKPVSEFKDNGTEFIGADGRSLVVWRGGLVVKDAQGKELPKPPTGHPPQVGRGSQGGVDPHMRDFLQCVKSRERPRSDLASMYRTTTCCHLANIALLAGTSVRWDAEKNDLAGSAGRETLPYRRRYRRPWSLPDEA